MPDPSGPFTVFLPIISGGPAVTPKPISAPAIYIDLHRCIGCNACSLACKQENNVQLGELWNQVYGTETGANAPLGVRVLPMFCHQCGDAPCKNKCDELGYRAIVRRTDGILYVNAGKCTGCQQCVPVCPYKSMAFNTQTKKAEKCHFCMHRIDVGQLPACVITCLAITREYGDYSALLAKHPDAKPMGDNVHVLYGHMGEEPVKGRGDLPTNGFPDPAPCHD